MGNKIWREDSEYYKLAQLTDKAVKEAEEKLNVVLPKTYINLLKEQNGGYINFNSFPSNVPTTWADNHINVDHIFGIGEGEGILESEYLIQEWGLPENIVLISGSGHSWVALDYRKTKEEPPIIYLDEDSEIIEIASNFEAFLNGLYIEKVIVEDAFFEQDVKHWTLDELEIAFLSNNEQEIIIALNYLYENTAGNEQFIEQKLINLLQHPILDMKQLGANYAGYFNEMGIISSNGVKEMVSIMRKDNQIEYYVDMFFV